MKNIEIPFKEDRDWRYRFWEILPGALSWTILLMPFVLSVFNPTLFAMFIIAYLLLWFFKGLGMSVRSVQGYRMLSEQQSLDWFGFLDDLEVGAITHPQAKNPKWHHRNLKRLSEFPLFCKPSEVMHALIVTLYNEPREVLEPTIQSILKSNYDMKKVILIIAYEERTGPDIEKLAQDIIKEYGQNFYHAEAVKHTVLPGEVRGKGGNITHSGRWLKEYIEKKHIDPARLVVTTLDTDNRPHPSYLAALTYTFCSSEDPRYVSYQPLPIYTNNIWDAPAPMRVIATGNSFWNIVLGLRPHMLRNFSSHAQSMQALIDTDFWSVRTIVEDGHQFWRTYFRFDGRHEVYPIFTPIYQDAVLAETYRRTIKAQFLQIRRWAWGASDVAYVATMGFRKGSKVPKVDLLMKLGRLLEGHISWATASLLILVSPLIPAVIQPENFVANQLPRLASTIQTVALSGVFVSLLLSLKFLPPRPLRYKRHRNIFMVLQWVLLPLTTLLFNTAAAITSQTKLMFGRYLDNFDVTEKAVKK
jgi:cellulose synthase/poly-beta-1,6-N-acetylglucosamine synthase-like glycosyltransferase